VNVWVRFVCACVFLFLYMHMYIMCGCVCVYVCACACLRRQPLLLFAAHSRVLQDGIVRLFVLFVS
jgi:hypothetical protein